MTRRIYLDLDGVMADFDGSFPAVFGLDHRSMADDDMWLKINGHPTFFRDLPPMAGAVDFFRSIEHLEPIILTACPKSNYAHVATQKVEWVRAHLSGHVTVLPVLGGSSKPLFMHAKGDILIDDFRRNTEAWAAAGGHAILHRGFEGTAAALEAAIGPYAAQPAEQPRGERVDVGLLREVVVSLRSCGMHYSLANDVEKLHEALVSAQAAQPKPEQAVGDGGWRHAANEWADVATNGIVVLQNVRDGITTFDDAIAEWRKNVERARASQPTTPRLAVATPAEVTDEQVKRATVAFNDYSPRSDRVSIQPGRCWDHRQMRVALEAAALAAQRPAGVPEAKVSEPDDHPDAGLYIKGWNDCREAMIAAAPEVPRG